MSNWKPRFKAYKKALGLTNKDIAENLNLSLNSVEVMTAKETEDFPKWAKSAIITHETMQERGRIIYDIK